MEGFIYICLSIHPSFLPFIFLLPPVHPPLALPGPAVPPPPGLGCPAGLASEWEAQGQAH